MIPFRFLPKLGCYTIKIKGVTIHVRLVDRAAMVDVGLNELKPLIGKTTAVGLMVYMSPRYSKPAILQLCVGTRCLLVHLFHMDSIPECLQSFLSDPVICFVGVNMSKWKFGLSSSYKIECKGCIEVGELVAKYFKKPKLCTEGLAAVAAEVELPLEESSQKVEINWHDKVFSNEEIKLGIQDVYACHLIGSKILAMLLYC